MIHIYCTMYRASLRLFILLLLFINQYVCFYYRASFCWFFNTNIYKNCKECFDCVALFLFLDDSKNTHGSRLKLCFYYKRKVLNTQEEIQICYTLYMPPLWCYWYKSQNKVGPSFAVPSSVKLGLAKPVLPSKV